MCADLLLLGGGHAHLPLIQVISSITERGHRVTCVSPSPVHYYSGMGPGMLGGFYEPAEIRFPIEEMVVRSGGEFVVDRAVRIDAKERRVALAGGDMRSYDVLSVNTGSTIARTVRQRSDAAGPALFRPKPLEELVQARDTLRTVLAERATRIAVVGGGPAAIEIAGNVRRLACSIRAADSRVELLAGRGVLPGFSRRASRIAVRALERAGVAVRRESRVEASDGTGLVVNGASEHYDFAILATGITPSRLFVDSDLPVGPDGSLAVDDYLHALGYPNIYGGGDCIWFTPHPLARAGVFAVREGPVLVHNVMASLDSAPSRRLVTFRRSGAYMLLMNLGDGTALFWRRILGLPVVVRGKLVFTLKDRIDRSFMERFGSEAGRTNGQSREGT